MDELLSTELLRRRSIVHGQLSSETLGSALASFDEDEREPYWRTVENPSGGLEYTGIREQLKKFAKQGTL